MEVRVNKLWKIVAAIIDSMILSAAGFLLSF
jgi:hypothetical protein